MRAQAFPTCCGAIVLTEFGHSETRPEVNPSLDEIKKWTENIINDPQYIRGYGLATAMLNTKQVKAGVSGVLKGLGFKNVAKGHAPKHGNNINCYVYTFNETKKVD